MAFNAMKPRNITCSVCGNSATESFYGIGFPNFLRLMDIFDESTKQNPLICPECRNLLLSWLNKKAKIMPVIEETNTIETKEK